MGENTEVGITGFETVYKFVGGHGRFQWLCVLLVSTQVFFMFWNHMSYIFVGAVPDHWCLIPELQESNWSEDQIKNISIPKQFGIGNNWKYEQCYYYNIDYKTLLERSNGNFDVAYLLTHNNLENLNFKNISHSKETTSCKAWTYDRSIYLSTVVTEFDLVCSKRYLVASIQASYMFGGIIGNFASGPINDRILGRRNTMLCAMLLVITGGFISSFSTSYIMLIGCRFFVAIGTASSLQAGSVWLLEHLDTESRARMYCLMNLSFGISLTIMPIYAYFIRTWFNLQLAFSLSTLSLLSFYWIFPESPRWLASQGRDDEAIKALENIAKINKMPKPDRHDLQKCVEACHKATEASNETTKSTNCVKKLFSSVKNFQSLVSTPELRKTTFTIWILFIAVAFVYYGLAFSAANITKNPYLVLTIGGLMEIPSGLLPIPFLSRWGRRPSVMAFYVLTAIAAFSIAVTPADYQILRTIELMMGKLTVAAAYTAAYFVLGEVYPTVIRSTGRGAGALVGRFGSTAAPYVSDMLTTVYPDLPTVIFGIVALSAAPFAIFLPEMKGVGMKDQVKDKVNCVRNAPVQDVEGHVDNL